MKRLFAILICIFMLIPFAYVASGEELTPPSLSGSTYTVSTASQLRWISAVTSGEIKPGSKNYPSTPTFEGYTIVLNSGVTLGQIAENEGVYELESGDMWTPIGNETTPFKGTFNGNDYTIKGVYVKGDFNHSGFFGVVDGGTINEVVINGYISGNKSVGGIAGKIKGDTNKCIFTGHISGGEKTGGIAGEITGTPSSFSEVYLTIASCSIETMGGEAAGGIAGYGEYVNISSCAGTKNIYSFSSNTGGIIGLAGKEANVSCSNYDGVITADGNSTTAGGVIGCANDGFHVINSHFKGRLHCSGFDSSVCGGIIGSGNGKIENSFVNAEVYSSLYFQENTANKKCISAGMIGDSSEASIINCYFDGISEAQGVEGYWLCQDSVNVENGFYSKGIAYILYETGDLFHVVALREALSAWANDVGSPYSKWDSVLGVNDTKPMLKHTNVAGGDGEYGWRIEGTVFTYYTDGAMDDYEVNFQGTVDTPWAIYRSVIRTINIDYGVTRIGNNAFNSFDALRTLNLPSTLKEIGDYAFEHCQYLKNFNIPSSVNDIGEGAFRGCKDLTKVTIPSGVRAIRASTFSQCEELETITIPQTVSYIGYMAFSACDSLVSVNLPQSVRDLEEYAFYYCDNLETVNLPSLLNRIGSYAFGRCDKLVDFSIPSSANVEENAFWSTTQHGDIDGDGKYTVVDYMKVKRYFLGMASLTASEVRLADCDFDGRITVSDYIAIKKYMLK